MADKKIEAQILTTLQTKAFFIHYLLSDAGTVYVAGYLGMGEWMAIQANAAMQEAIEALLGNGRVKVSEQIETHWLQVDVEREGVVRRVPTGEQVTGRRLLAVTDLES